MKQMKLTIIALFSALLVVCASSSAFAATYGQAAAVMYYDTLSISFDGLTPALTTYADYNGTEDTPAGTEALVETDNGWGWAEVDVTDSEKDLYADAYVDSPASYEYAYANAELSASFTAEEAGSVTVSIDYYLYIDGTSDAASSAWAYAEALAYLSINDEEVTDIFGDDVIFYNGISYEGDTPVYTLTLTYKYDANDTVNILAGVSAYAEAAVPVPGAGLLLSAGLIALAGIRRKN